MGDSFVTAFSVARRASHVRMVLYNTQINGEQFRCSFLHWRGARHMYIRAYVQWGAVSYVRCFIIPNPMGDNFATAFPDAGRASHVRLGFYNTQTNSGQFRYSFSSGEARITRTFCVS